MGSGTAGNLTGRVTVEFTVKARTHVMHRNVSVEIVRPEHRVDRRCVLPEISSASCARPTDPAAEDWTINLRYTATNTSG